MRPVVALHFLRSGTQYTATWDAVDSALAEARARVDAGAALDPELPEYVADELAEIG